MTTSRKTTTTALTILAIILTAAWLANPVGLWPAQQPSTWHSPPGA